MSKCSSSCTDNDDKHIVKFWCLLAEWKVADVRPLLKISNMDNCTALETLDLLAICRMYRSLLNIQSSIKQMISFLNTQRLYPRGQSAYRNCHSTETALLRITIDTMMNMNR